MSGLHRKRKQLRRLKIRNITLNTVCILLAFGGISWTVNYFWKYVNYEITNDAVVDQYITPVNIRVPGYIREGLFGQEVGITSMVLFELPEAGFRLGDIGLLYADIHLGGFDAGT